MRVAPAAELLPVPERGRRFTHSRTVWLGDVDPSARLRFDAVARFLQDVATADANDCGLDDRFGWVVRRTMIRVERSARLEEQVELTTFCTGTGRSWAERRTSLRGERGAAIEAVSLWVQVDPTTGRPAPLGDNFHDIYGEAAHERQVSTRLRLPSPTGVTDRRAWPVRRVDLDPFDHVNNAVHWAAIEETVTGAASRRGTAELEYLLPVDVDTDVEMQIAPGDGGFDMWLVAGDRVYTSGRWRPSVTGR